MGEIINSDGLSEQEEHDFSINRSACFREIYLTAKPFKNISFRNSVENVQQCLHRVQCRVIQMKNYIRITHHSRVHKVSLRQHSSFTIRIIFFLFCWYHYKNKKTADWQNHQPAQNTHLIVYHPLLHAQYPFMKGSLQQPPSRPRNDQLCSPQSKAEASSLTSLSQDV